MLPGHQTPTITHDVGVFPRSLVEEHRLLFATLLCLNIQEENGEYFSEEEISLLIQGGHHLRFVIITILFIHYVKEKTRQLIWLSYLWLDPPKRPLRFIKVKILRE